MRRSEACTRTRRSRLARHVLGRRCRPKSLRGGPLDGAHDGYLVEFWSVPDERNPFATVVITPQQTLFCLLLCERGGPAGDHVQVFADDGATSRQGPMSTFADLATFAERSFDMVLHVLARQALRNGEATAVSDRTYAQQSSAFVAFADSQPVPLVDSWVVADRIELSSPPCDAIELWHRTVDRVTQPPNPYHTPWVAAAYEASGRIVGMLAVETMPEVHDDAFVVVFHGGTRTNLGAAAATISADEFRQVAIDVLVPLLRSA